MKSDSSPMLVRYRLSIADRSRRVVPAVLQVEGTVLLDCVPFSELANAPASPRGAWICPARRLPFGLLRPSECIASSDIIEGGVYPPELRRFGY